MAVLPQVPLMILASCQCVYTDCLRTKLQFTGIQNAVSATRDRSTHLDLCVCVRLGVVPGVVRAGLERLGKAAASRKRLSCLRVRGRLY